MANDDNLRTLYDDEGMRTVTVKDAGQNSAREQARKQMPPLSTNVQADDIYAGFLLSGNISPVNEEPS